ncbi:transcription elongation factor spt-4 [Colletotrichum simmondsii]|uniref:Transcription elongation factor SPT4 n=1 Tax=Colletotrichum simmondsii TaxID=703756 RepID=A0A135RWX1_9PEZI|nr:transcription elongation factor spt-4 [Colletotrichum simmondsii]
MSADNFVAPGQQRYLRACMVCSIVMTYSVRPRSTVPTTLSGRKASGETSYCCPNCEDFLHMAGSQDQIESCTSQVFEGLITLSNPKRSWVAKWQRLDNYVRGVYAIKVSGQLPDEIRNTLEEEYRIHYIPRDGTETEVDA